jgi:hypothetical protein
MSIPAKVSPFTISSLMSVNWYDVRRLNQPYSRSRMKAFFNNDTIKSLLHVPRHLDFSTNDPIVFHFLRVEILLQG